MAFGSMFSHRLCILAEASNPDSHLALHQHTSTMWVLRYHSYLRFGDCSLPTHRFWGLEPSPGPQGMAFLGASSNFLSPGYPLGISVLSGLLSHSYAVLSLHKNSPTSSLERGQELLLCWGLCDPHSCGGEAGVNGDPPLNQTTALPHASPPLQVKTHQTTLFKTVYFIYFFCQTNTLISGPQ